MMAYVNKMLSCLTDMFAIRSFAQLCGSQKWTKSNKGPEIQKNNFLCLFVKRQGFFHIIQILMKSTF